ncbi:VOC family protein [Bacillus sp. CGMCC 1.16607]|uniref:VOC family protein n=1 Tax=Bacillus sp. CGMCC 1.16607 TaxID=3351842 RepID=UPI00363DF0D7
MIKGLYEAHLPVSDMNASIKFYEKLGLTIANKGETVSFMWIEKGKSWIGLWESKEVHTPYHPSLRHIAFHVDLEDMIAANEWLKSKNISVREDFGFKPERQPLVLNNNPHAHAAIYFDDPDGNSLELITPLRLDVNDSFEKMELKDWLKLKK